MTKLYCLFLILLAHNYTALEAISGQMDVIVSFEVIDNKKHYSSTEILVTLGVHDKIMVDHSRKVDIFINSKKNSHTMQVDGDRDLVFYGTNRKLPSEQELIDFNLKEGRNNLILKYGDQEIANVTMNVWNKNSKLVITGFDGTISKFTVKGIVLNLFNANHFHDNITEFFNFLQENDNNIKIICISSRLPSMFKSTKNILNKLNLGHIALLHSNESTRNTIFSNIFKSGSDEIRRSMITRIKSLFYNNSL